MVINIQNDDHDNVDIDSRDGNTKIKNSFNCKIEIFNILNKKKLVIYFYVIVYCFFLVLVTYLLNFHWIMIFHASVNSNNE